MVLSGQEAAEVIIVKRLTGFQQTIESTINSLETKLQKAVGDMQCECASAQAFDKRPGLHAPWQNSTAIGCLLWSLDPQLKSMQVCIASSMGREM